MDSLIREFVGSLISPSPSLNEVYRETMAYWSPEKPPVTALLADLGARIATDFDRAGFSENRRIFQLIEDGMGTDSVALTIAVATGLIEAMLGLANKDRWERMRPFGGNRTVRHAEAWLAPC